MLDAFYEPDGERFRATELTRGPWDPDAQHAGPPAALLGRAIELCPSPLADPAAPSASRQVARVTFEILRPVPIGALTVRAEVVRPGRRVELISASLVGDGEELMRASAWRIGAGGVDLPAGLASEERGSPARRAEALPGPERGVEEDFFATGERVGFHTAMEFRFVRGRFLDLGPATVWMRPRHALVAGELLSPLQRVVIAADSGNGVSAALDWGRFTFINVDLGVHLHRLPAGEWVCVDAVTVPEPSGIGLADSTLHDELGPLGRALQTLLVRERPTPPATAP
ncbi:MAG: thioesterase family protein [Solirubrobacterales bacterium]|nr:thioesterase family protein [Solirubrobacterales bacterium]